MLFWTSISLFFLFRCYLALCLLLISELITKLVHSSIESVSTAQQILLVIEQEGLLRSCTHRLVVLFEIIYCFNYVS